MRLVDDQERVVGQKVEQAVRALAFRATAQVTRVVLDAGAGPGLAHHLHVEVGALAQTLGLEQTPARFEQLHALLELRFDGDERPFHLLLGGHVVGGGEDRQLVAHGEDLTGERIEILDRLDGVTHELDAGRDLLIRGLDVDDVAAHPKARASKVHVVAGVLQVGELAQQDVPAPRLAALDGDRLAQIVLRRADAVDARDGCDHDHVAPGEQRAGRAVAQPVDLVVARRILLDVRVGARDVGLGLVEVVVRDEVLHRVLGEEFAELGPELGGERLVGREHQRRTLLLGDHVGDGEGLARPGHPEQDLLALALGQPAIERCDRGGLITGGFERREQLESGHPLSLMAVELPPNSAQITAR